LDPRAQDIETAVSDWSYSVVHDPHFNWTAAFTLPPLAQLVIYEMYIPSFNVVAGANVGTFDSAIARLPFLAQLGINMIELMPVGMLRALEIIFFFLFFFFLFLFFSFFFPFLLSFFFS
jgi:1,4-alpha-glucan branching enzyme